MNPIKIKSLQKPITTTVTIPGSKSYTNRALFLAALIEKPIIIKNPLLSSDTRAMIGCLQTLGIKISISKNQIDVVGSVKDIKEKKYELDANLSGITLRFILALATIIPGTKILFGKEGLNKRPIKDLVDGLIQLGAKIEYLEQKGFPPLRVTTTKLKSKHITVNGELSSQYLSALLLIAPLIGDINITIKGNQISKPYIAMTIDIMKQFGVNVTNKKNNYHIKTGQKYNINNYIVEGDFSSAGYFFAIAALTKSTLTIKNLNHESKQADKKLLTVLEKMGNKIIYGKNEIKIIGKGVKPMAIDVIDFPDQAQTLAVLAAFADGITKLSGIQSLRVKETDRIAALQSELAKMEIKTTVIKNCLTIYGGNPKSARINTYGDHRMAMAFAIAGTKLNAMEINNPEVVDKTFPEFWKKMNEIGIKPLQAKKTNIVLVGMRGSGKSTIGRILAQKLQKNFIDLDAKLATKLGKSLKEIITENGWEYFRNQEVKLVRETKRIKNTVIATGGGVVLKKENVEALRKHGCLIFLNAHPDILIKRISGDSERPALTNQPTIKEEMYEIFKQREQLYKTAADIIIDTDTPKKITVVERIINKL